MIKLQSKMLMGLLGISLLLSGCAKQEVAITPATVTNNQQQNNGANGNEGKRVQQIPDLFGKVKSIIGNEVFLEIAEMPQRESRPEGETATRPAGAMGQGQGAGLGQGNRVMKFTGETATILIPVGVPITTFSQGGAKQIDIGDIYEGSLLQIWFDENDKESKSITRVSVMQGRQ